MTRCPEREIVTDKQCIQDVADHRIAMSEWGLMLLHTIGGLEELNWYSGPGYERFLGVERAKRAGKTYR